VRRETRFRQGPGAGILSGSAPFYKYTQANNRSADLSGKSAAFCCRSRIPTSPYREITDPKEQGPAPTGPQLRYYVRKFVKSLASGDIKDVMWH
jgi:hypothetical protein